MLGLLKDTLGDMCGLMPANVLPEACKHKARMADLTRLHQISLSNEHLGAAGHSKHWTHSR